MEVNREAILLCDIDNIIQEWKVRAITDIQAINAIKDNLRVYEETQKAANILRSVGLSEKQIEKMLYKN